MTFYFTEWDSPMGTILLTSNGVALTGLYLEGRAHGPDWVRQDEADPFPEARRQLGEYFAGRRTEFSLPLAPGGTEFQRRVWDELGRIPHGVTVSYGELARRIGQPKASRAVGLANGRNPISVVVPCHRVVGASGRLIGYARGIARKEALLALERCTETYPGSSLATPP